MSSVSGVHGSGVTGAGLGQSLGVSHTGAAGKALDKTATDLNNHDAKALGQDVIALSKYMSPDAASGAQSPQSSQSPQSADSGGAQGGGSPQSADSPSSSDTSTDDLIKMLMQALEAALAKKGESGQGSGEQKPEHSKETAKV